MLFFIITDKIFYIYKGNASLYFLEDRKRYILIVWLCITNANFVVTVCLSIRMG